MEQVNEHPRKTKKSEAGMHPAHKLTFQEIQAAGVEKMLARMEASSGPVSQDVRASIYALDWPD